MKVNYIYHSGFSIELDSCVLIFDYFKGDLCKFDKSKRLYVFSSHSHHDHFSSSIFDLEKEYSNVFYILSNDIKTNHLNNTVFIGANETKSIDNLKVSTLKSSDLGVAFIVNVDGYNIYHAGDLNHWHWDGESDLSNKEALHLFRDEVDKIKGNSFDVAFLPLDPRQGDYYYLGFDYFMTNTNTTIAFPMHMWDDYSIVDKFMSSKYCGEYKDKIMKVSNVLREFVIRG